MCLELTKDFSAADVIMPLLKGGELMDDEITCYKVVNKKRKGDKFVYRSIYQNCEIRFNTDYISNRRERKLSSVDKYDNTVDIGIHVFLDKEGAITEHKDFGRNKSAILKCTARIEDLVAAGYFPIHSHVFSSAVFMKVKVEKEIILDELEEK